MNDLIAYVRDNQIDEAHAMNALQEHGIVSDNCVMAADVCNADAAKAVAWLKKYFR